jgi:glycosyltransferase involved in cell wall biosynthesis
MISFAVVPKPFNEQFARLQINSILSIVNLPEENEVFLLGSEEGIEEFAKANSLTHLKDIDYDEFHTPLINSVFMQVMKFASNDIICYINADIIVVPDLINTVKRCSEQFKEFLLVSKRWNIDFKEEISFSKGWEQPFLKKIKAEGKLFAPQAIDIFVFTKNIYDCIPAFAIGRSYWDNWLIYEARRKGVPVIDLTDSVTITHQNHDYAGFATLAEIRRSVQGRRNFFYAGDHFLTIATIRDSTHHYANDEFIETDVKKVSVIIPHRGRIQPLKKCINSLTHQTYPRTFIEIWVVINDPDCDYGSLRNEFPFANFCKELKIGPAAARNTGTSCCSGEIIAFIDSDCVADPRWVEEGTQILNLSTKGCVVAGKIARKKKATIDNPVEFLDQTIFLQQEKYVSDYQRCATANMFVTRAYFFEIGFFDESFNEASGEDWDWSRMAVEKGAVIYFSHDAIVFHPSISNKAQLLNKFLKIIRGNNQRYRKEIASSTGLARSSFQNNFPTYYRLIKRIRKVYKSKEISLWMKLKCSLILISIWPEIRKEWKKVTKLIEV